MPWNLSQRDGKWCVVKVGESSPVPGGCHATRMEAIKHQRALYASESRMASMYSELDEITEEHALEVVPAVPVSAAASELVKIEIGKENEALTASVLAQMEKMSEREAQTQAALVAALHAIGTRSPEVHVAAPNVDVAAPNVTVESPAVTVEAPNVTVEAAAAPNVTVHPEINLPSPSKTVTFERDPLTGQVSKAEVTEA